MFDALPEGLPAASDPGLPPPPSVGGRRRLRGRAAARTGRSAEDRALRRYTAEGWRLVGRNWRAGRLHGGGEIDLIFARPGLHVFVEVKARRSLAEAAGAVSPAQRARLEAAACRWMELAGHHGEDLRLDLALCDREGRLEILENAFA